jgi:hypothetical protein
VTDTADVSDHLAEWLRIQLGTEVRIDGLDRVDFGHSAEMLALTVVTQQDDTPSHRDVVVRLRPRPPRYWSPTTWSGSSAF